MHNRLVWSVRFFNDKCFDIEDQTAADKDFAYVPISYLSLFVRHRENGPDLQNRRTLDAHPFTCPTPMGGRLQEPTRTRRVACSTGMLNMGRIQKLCL